MEAPEKMKRFWSLVLETQNRGVEYRWKTPDVFCSWVEEWGGRLTLISSVDMTAFTIPGAVKHVDATARDGFYVMDVTLSLREYRLEAPADFVDKCLVLGEIP
jgi:hypothetical protein